MTTRYLSIPAKLTAGEAISLVRKSAQDVETVYYIYVVDEYRKLAGIISLRELLSADDSKAVSSIMETELITVREDTDQEEAARLLETHDLIAVPVIDDSNRLLGIITFDDIIDVIREEQTEDVYKMGAMEGTPDPYLETSIFRLVKKRVPWLIVLLLFGTITTNVVHHYEHLILGASFLFIFMSVITQTGGNCGNQSTALIIRGLATNDIHFRDLAKVMGKELLTGLILGLCTGLVILLRSWLLPPGIDIFEASAVGLSLMLVVLFSNVVGAAAPIIIDKMGMDPAVMSGPLMATVIDVIGLTIYFETAKFLLGLS
jgi:magnesium transporter